MLSYLTIKATKACALKHYRGSSNKNYRKLQTKISLKRLVVERNGTKFFALLVEPHAF